MKQGLWFVLGGAALALAGGCSEDPALYPGGPAGPPTELQLSDSKLTLLVGQTAELGVQPRDAVGNAAAAAVQIATCDASMVSVTTSGGNTQWAERATVTALALGESCLLVTGGSITDSVHVFMGPASARIVGPDTVLSGSQVSYSVEFYAMDGSVLPLGSTYPAPTVQSLNTLRLPVTQTAAVTYDGAGQQPGSVSLQINDTNDDFGKVTTEKVIVIVPGVFSGTVSANTAAQGGTLTVTGAIPWDGDEYVTLGEIPGSMWSGLAADPIVDPSGGSLTFEVPWSLPPGTYSLTVLNQGPTQIAGVATSEITVTAGTPVVNWNSFPGTNTSGAELRTKISLDRPLAFPVVFSDNPNPEDRSYYTLDNRGAPSGNAGEVVLRVTLDWVDSCGEVCDPAADEDVDIEIIDGAFTAFLDLDGATLAVPESTLFNFQEGAFYFVRIRTFSGAAATHVVVEWLGDGTLCGDQSACNIGGET